MALSGLRGWLAVGGVICATALAAAGVDGEAGLRGGGGGNAGAGDTDLSVSRVVVYSSGVAYYLVEGKVEGDATAELTFRRQQINDVLKSLTVRDLDGGTVSVVRYASQDPVDRALRSFGVDISGRPSLAQLLDQLRGEPLSIEGPRALRGVVLGVEKQKVPAGQASIDVDVLNLLTERGVEQIPIRDLQGVQLTNAKTDAELRRALATLAESRDADKKVVQVQFSGQGQRRVGLMYLLEAPLWKCSYRLAVRDDKSALLLGWATVENTTESDWRDVRLSLVSGRPISFAMDLYSPLYVPRPKVELDIFAGLRPPEFAADMAGESAVRERAPAAPAVRGAAAFGGGQGGGGRRGGAMELDKAPSEAADAGWAHDPGVASAATARGAGELFVYSIRQPVTIARQHSAMLPILDATVEIEKLSIYNADTHERYPLNGLQVKNTSGLHLMQGPVMVFDEDVYAGEAKIADLKPGEQRLLAYALDLGCEVRREELDVPTEMVSARISRGLFTRQNRLNEGWTYVVRNKAEGDKTVMIEHPYVPGWELVEPARADEKTEDLLRFRLRVKAGETVSRKVQLSYVESEQMGVAMMPNDWIIQFCANARISPALRAALQRLVELRTAHDEAARARAALEGELAAVITDQERLRKNVETLDRSTDAYQRQLRKFDEMETQIETLRARVAEAREQENARRKATEEYVSGLDVE